MEDPRPTDATKRRPSLLSQWTHRLRGSEDQHAEHGDQAQAGDGTSKVHTESVTAAPELVKDPVLVQLVAEVVTPEVVNAAQAEFPVMHEPLVQAQAELQQVLKEAVEQVKAATQESDSPDTPAKGEEVAPLFPAPRRKRFGWCSCL